MIKQAQDLGSRLAIDSRGVDQLRQTARQNAPEGVKQVAQQFEALFMNMVMKSMRDASSQEGGILDNQHSKTFTSMLDQQLSQDLAKRGVGLADVLIRQLSPAAEMNNATAPNSANSNNSSNSLNAINAGNQALLGSGSRHGEDGPQEIALMMQGGLDQYRQTLRANPAASGSLPNEAIPSAAQALGATLLQTSTPRPGSPSVADAGAGMRTSAAAISPNIARANVSNALANDNQNLRRVNSQPAHVKNFQTKLAAQADEASRTTGIPAKFLLGQAALESGWGKREIVGSDGRVSHNLFGIKATSSWKGRVVEAVTTEYVNGAPQLRKEKFRAYDSYADAFRDYAKLLSKNPRYENVIANAQDASSFARGLQRAGYATDPNYAAKLTRIINNSLT